MIVAYMQTFVVWVFGYHHAGESECSAPAEAASYYYYYFVSLGRGQAGKRTIANTVRCAVGRIREGGGGGGCSIAMG